MRSSVGAPPPDIPTPAPEKHIVISLSHISSVHLDIPVSQLAIKQSYTANTNNKIKLEVYPWHTIKLYKLQVHFCELLQYLHFSVLESIFKAAFSVLRAASLAQCCDVLGLLSPC